MADSEVIEIPESITINGVTLYYQPVNYVALRHLRRKSADILARIRDESLSEEERYRVAQESADHWEQFFSYLVGWGIKNRVPEMAQIELAAIGMDSESSYLRRANWVRYLVTQTDAGRSAIIADICLVTELHHKGIVKDE